MLACEAQLVNPNTSCYELPVSILNLFRRRKDTGDTEELALTIEGYGWSIAPREPFEIGRLSEDRVVFSRTVGKETKQLMVQPPPTTGEFSATIGTLSTGLSPGTLSQDDVVFGIEEELSSVPFWTITTGSYHICWPTSLHVWSVPQSNDWLFELSSPDSSPGEMIYIMGPFAKGDAPNLDALVSSDMPKTNEGTTASAMKPARWIEVCYRRGGVQWRQRRYLIELFDRSSFLVTAQATEDSASGLFDAATEVVGSLTCATEATNHI